MAKDYDIQQKIEALGIDLREVQKILHETGSELQRAEKELCDADEALACFDEKKQHWLKFKTKNNFFNTFH